MKTFRPLILMLLAAFLLAACSVSLAEDLTPPPGAQAPISAPQGASMGAGSSSPASSGPVYPVVAPDPEKGKTIYAEKCAPCHGDKGMGDGPKAAQLSVPVAAIGDPKNARQATPASWFTIVTNGNIERFMPPFANGLTDRERWDVVAYVFTLSQTADTLSTGKDAYTANCADCHGQTGLGDGPKAADSNPRSFHNLEFMASQTDQALFDAITNGVQNKMQAYNQLSEDQRWALVAYVRSLTYAAPGATNAASGGTPEPAAQSTAVSGVITPTAAISTTGYVTVTVNMPVGKQLPDNVEVALYAFDNMTLAYSTTQSTRSGKVFTFNNVEMPSSRAFIASAKVDGVTYGSDVAVPNAKGAIGLVVPIYETTTDTSSLVIDRLHMFFDFTQPNLVQVVEVYVFTNPSDKTVTSAEKGGPVTKFAVPEGATNLQFQDGSLGQKYVEIPGGFADTSPVRAGDTSYQVMFAFDLPYSSGSAKFSQLLNYNVNSSIVLLPDNGVKLKSDTLKEGAPQAIQGANYKVFTGDVIKSGASVAIELSGKPGSASSGSSNPFSFLGSSDSQTSLLIGLAALGLVLIFAGVWLWRRERSTSAELDEEEDEEEEEPEDDLDDADSLMDAIIALDDQYKDGQISEEAYKTRRAEMKERLRKRME